MDARVPNDYNKIKVTMYSLRFAAIGRPKLPAQEPKRNARFEELEMIGLLDQCRQILREDKIFIRNKIKESDQETMNIFRKHRKPAADLQTLQIQLRKHVATIKSKYKHEQIVRFKENLSDAFCLSEKPKNVDCDQSKKPPKPLEGKENNFRNRLKSSLNLSEGKRTTLDNSYGKKAQNSLSKSLRPNEAARECSAEKEASSRPKTQVGRQYCKTISNLEAVFRSDEKARSWRQKTLPSEKKDTDAYWNEQYSRYVGGRKEFEKEMMKQQLKPEEDSIQQKLENFSVNISETQLDNGQVNIRLPTFEGDTYPDQNDMCEFERVLEKTKEPQALFTSPELLRQCRNILNQKSNSNLGAFDRHANPLAETQSAKAQLRKVQINLDEGVQVDTIFEESSEELFDRYFFGGKATISREVYQRLTEAHCSQQQKYVDLFDAVDKNGIGTISASAFGAAVSARCRPKHNTVQDVYSLIDIERNGWCCQADVDRFLSQITDAGSDEGRRIIDITNRYVQQLFRLFRNADAAGSDRVGYWDLYLMKNSNEFQQFTTYLEQFEFEIEL